MLIGYARVSSTGQSLDVQLEQLEAAGCTKVFKEKRSGKSGTDRPALKEALEFAREGDALTITRLDRLARSVKDLEEIVEALKRKGVALRATEQSIDTSTAAGTAFYQMLGVFAQFENALRRERQAEGIAKAHAEGVQFGRPKSPHEDAIRAALEAGESPTAIKARLASEGVPVARSTIYRIKGDLEAEAA